MARTKKYDRSLTVRMDSELYDYLQTCAKMLECDISWLARVVLRHGTDVVLGALKERWQFTLEAMKESKK